MTYWAKAHADLSRLFDPAARYAGYKPDVAEAPNGDTKVCGAAGCDGGERKVSTGRYEPCPTCRGTGRVPNVDAGRAGKRYLHVAEKYLRPYGTHPDGAAWPPNPAGLDFARDYLARAHYEACLVAAKLGVPAAFMPRAEFGALRVLEYPSAGHDNGGVADECLNCDAPWEWFSAFHVCPALAAGAGTAEHTDVDLFTLNLWRSTPEDHEQECPCNGAGCPRWYGGAPAYHLGRIGEIIGLGPAALHRVPARPYVQRALVYFAVPDHAVVISSSAAGYARVPNLTVGQYLERELARMRVAKGSY